MKVLPDIGDIVASTAGHDCKRLYAVVAVVGENYVLIADGGGRSVSCPKLKKIKHIRKVCGDGALKQAIALGKADDNSVSAAIAGISGGSDV